MTPRLALIGALLVMLAIYGRTTTHGFNYEDFNWVPTLTDDLQWHLPGRTLTMATYHYEHRLGFGASEMHALNVALFMVLGVSVFGLARAFMREEAAACTAMVVLWHPLNSQAVAYLSARTDLLMTLAIVWACLCALRGWWGLAAGCAVVAMTAKESGVIVLPLVAWTLLIAGRLTRWHLLGGVLAGIAAVFGARRLWSFVHVDGYLDVVGIQAVGVWRHLRLFVWPVGLSIDADPWAVADRWRLVAAGAVVPLVVAAVACVRRAPVVALGLGWCVLGVSLRLVGLSTGEPLHEHQVLVSSIGLCLIGGQLIASVLPMKASAYA